MRVHFLIFVLVFFGSCISGQMKACDSEAGTELLDIILTKVFHYPIVHMISVLLLLNKFCKNMSSVSYHLRKTYGRNNLYSLAVMCTWVN